jgi:hypothetical protein
VALRYWFGGTGTWDTTSTTNWSAASPLALISASCSGTTLTTTGSPALVVGMTVRSSTNVSLGTVSSGSGNSWVVSVGGTYASQSMTAATVGASVPTTADSVNFFSNASSTNAYTVTLSGALNCGSFLHTSKSPTFAGTGTLALAGASFIIGSTATWSATGLITMTSAFVSLQTNGVTISSPITYNSSGGTIQLDGALTLATARTFTLTQGTLDLVSYTLTTGLFNSTGSITRTIAFGTGNITVNGAGGTIWSSFASGFSVTGTPVVNVSYSGATSVSVSVSGPFEANTISFNFTTGTYALTMVAGSWRNLNFTGFAGSVANTANTIYGNLTLDLAASYTSGASAWTFASTSTGKTITTNGETVTFPLIFDGVGGSWELQDALTMGATRSLTHTNGTLNLNGKTLTVGSQYITATGTKNLTFNGGTLVCPAVAASAFSNAVPTGFTTTAGTGTGTISMTGATAKTFAGGGSTYNCTINQGGAGALTITGANTFNNITNTTQPASVLFTAGTTTTFNDFNLNGTAGNLITIGSVTAASHTLSKTSGTVSCNHLSISRSTATGGATWYAGANSTDGGNNTGWIFSGPSSGSFFIVL